MTSSEHKKLVRKPLAVSLLVITLAGLGGAVVSRFLLRSAESSDIVDALVSTSQVGGIVAGFVLTATAILSLGGNYREYVLKQYGGLVRALLLTSFSLAMVSSIAGGLAPVMKNFEWLELLLGVIVGFISLSLVTTLALFNGAFSWGDSEAAERARKPKTPAPR